MLAPVPTFADVLCAAARISAHAAITPVLHSRSLDALSGARLAFKAENLQRSGAFKFRGACNAVQALDAATAAPGVVTHSSGNHGAALALAARGRGIACHVIVPDGARPCKLAAMTAYGATIHRCDPSLPAREAACAAVQAATGAMLIHPYANPQVIAGQATAVLELLHAAVDLTALVVPVGGGGLAAGAALVLAELAPHIRLFLAEPAGAADAAVSLRTGVRVADSIPDTVCDGLRATLGALNFEILRRSNAQVLLLEDAATCAAQRLLLERSKLVVEPSAAIALAAVLTYRQRFAGQHVGLVLSGGNVDVDALA